MDDDFTVEFPASLAAGAGGAEAAVKSVYGGAFAFHVVQSDSVFILSGRSAYAIAFGYADTEAGAWVVAADYLFPGRAWRRGG